MVTHDEQIGQMLAKLDELGIADNTIVMYSTDNGPENDTWPDGANTPFRAQKDTNWEGAGAFRRFCAGLAKLKRDRFSTASSRTGHAADFSGGRRRSGRQPEAPGRLQDREHDLQGPHRWAQHGALPDR